MGPGARQVPLLPGPAITRLPGEPGGCSRGGTESRVRVRTARWGMVPSRCFWQSHKADGQVVCARGHGSARGRRAASAPARPSRAFLLTRLQTPLRRATPRCPPQRARWLGAPHPCCTPAWVRTSSCRQLGLQCQEKIHEDFSGTKSVSWQNPTCPAFGDGGRCRLCAVPPSGEQLRGPQTEAAGQKAAAATVFLLGDTPSLPAPRGPSLLSLHCPP